MKTLLFALATIFCFSAFPSALVRVDEKTKTVFIVANLAFFGKEASDNNINLCAQDIIKEWAPLSRGQSVYLGTKNNLMEGKYRIQMNIYYEKVSSQKAIANIRNRKIIENNYIEIPKDPNPELMNATGNTYHGFEASIYADAMKVPFKICAHEFGHMLGLGEMNSPNEAPSLMTQEGVPTNFPDFQVKVSDPRFFHRNAGTFDIALRKLGGREIQEIKIALQRLSFRDGAAYLNCNTCY